MFLLSVNVTLLNNCQSYSYTFISPFVTFLFLPFELGRIITKKDCPLVWQSLCKCRYFTFYVPNTDMLIVIFGCNPVNFQHAHQDFFGQLKISLIK